MFRQELPGYLAIFALLYICYGCYALDLPGRASWMTPFDLELIERPNRLDYANVTFWSSDFHVGPIEEVKYGIGAYGARVFDRSLSGHCHLYNTCATDLQVITKENGIELQPCPNRLRRAFYDTYRAHPALRAVHAFVCTHAAALCEVFMPFQRPLLVLSSTRFELGRFGHDRWQQWVENLQRIAAQPHNVVAANNLYDLHYIRYFTGIDVAYLPPTAPYVRARYAPTRPEILVGPARGHVAPVLTALRRACAAATTGSCIAQFAGIRDLYTHYEHTDLAQHPAIITVPYQVSLISLVEYYAMGLPMFVPSRRLLAHWHREQGVLTELTWHRVLHGAPGRGSLLPRHVNATEPYDPNNELSEQGLEYWLQYADFYQWPHIIYFDSFEEVLWKLRTVNLQEISASMREYHKHVRLIALHRWRQVLNRMLASPHSEGGEHQRRSSRSLPRDVNDALREQYGFVLREACDGQIDM